MVTFTGLVSGLDTASLISSLVSAERAAISPLATQRDQLSSQKSILSSITSQLGKLADVFKGMDLASEVRPRTATSSDAHVDVAVAGGTTPISHHVRVHQLAEAQW
ncbi:MAG: flagellar cap protein FliD N-terminal domain-containing protein [Kofleriaceae bacterium]